MRHVEGTVSRTLTCRTIPNLRHTQDEDSSIYCSFRRCSIASQRNLQHLIEIHNLSLPCHWCLPGNPLGFEAAVRSSVRHIRRRMTLSQRIESRLG